MKKLLAITLIITIVVLLLLSLKYLDIQDKLTETSTLLQQTKQSLSINEEMLNSATKTITSLNTTLDYHMQELVKLQEVYGKSKTELATTKTDLINAQNSIATTQADLANTREELTRTQAEAKASLDKLQLEVTKVQNSQSKLQEKLDLYKDTYGEIYSSIQPPYRGAYLNPTLTLVNNEKAHNPTWQELSNFLISDSTDKKTYEYLSYTCGNFAAALHNNAEAAGVRSAFVAINFTDSSKPHALNAFKTTDKGLVFIDNTGKPLEPPRAFLVGTSVVGQATTWDKVAYIQKGKPFGLVSLSNTYGTIYSEYERWGKDKSLYDSLASTYKKQLEAYNKEAIIYTMEVNTYTLEVLTYSTEVIKYNIAGGSSYSEYSRLETWRSRLSQQASRLDAWHSRLQLQSDDLDRQFGYLKKLSDALGALWEPGSIVKEVELYW